MELISKYIDLSVWFFPPIENNFSFSNIKIFSPIAETPIDDTERIQSTVKRNHAMTEETSSTVTVPASFIFRMLTSIYRLRQSEDMSGLDDDDDDDE